MPALLSDAEQITGNLKETTAASTEASQRTANVMRNLENSTKPLPGFIRWLPPLIGTAVGVATFGTLLEK
jgi:hypothetical protein